MSIVYAVANYATILLTIMYLLSIPQLKLKTASIDYHFAVLLLLPISDIVIIYCMLTGVLSEEPLFNQVPLGVSLFIGVVTIYLFRDRITKISPFKNFFRHLYLFYLYILSWFLVVCVLKIDLTLFIYIFLIGSRYLLMAFSVNYLRVVVLKTHYKILSFSTNVSASIYFVVSFIPFLPYLVEGLFLFLYIVYMITVYTAHLYLLLCLLAILSAINVQQKKF